MVSIRGIRGITACVVTLVLSTFATVESSLIISNAPDLTGPYPGGLPQTNDEPPHNSGWSCDRDDTDGISIAYVYGMESRHINKHEDRWSNYHCRIIEIAEPNAGPLRADQFNVCGPTELDDEFTCMFPHSGNMNDPRRMAIQSIQKSHNDDTEDASFTIIFARDERMILGTCAWSGWINNWDATFDWTCPPGQVMAGMHSLHDNGKEDRKFEFMCCDVDTSSPGTYIEIASGNIYTAPSGTFTHLNGATEPEPCPPGHSCPGGTAAPVPCDQGKYNPYPGEALCTSVCPTGAFCVTGSVEPVDCEPGTYNDELGQSQCKACTAGNTCPPGAAHQVPCPAGSFGALAGEYRELCQAPCPEFHYCPSGTSNPIPCDDGDFCPEGSADRTGCPAGYVCVAGESPQPCPPGHYCHAGSAVAAECDAGFYCQGGTEMPLPCVSGQFCPAGSSRPYPCQVGHWCSAMAAAPSPCPSGTFGSSSGLSGPEQCLPCDDGFACDEGSTHSRPAPCFDRCHTCTGTATTDCKSCSSGFAMSSAVSGTCEACDDACDECFRPGDSTACIDACADGYGRVDGTCVESQFPTFVSVPTIFPTQGDESGALGVQVTVSITGVAQTVCYLAARNVNGEEPPTPEQIRNIATGTAATSHARGASLEVSDGHAASGTVSSAAWNCNDPMEAFVTCQDTTGVLLQAESVRLTTTLLDVCAPQVTVPLAVTATTGESVAVKASMSEPATCCVVVDTSLVLDGFDVAKTMDNQSGERHCVHSVAVPHPDPAGRAVVQHDVATELNGLSAASTYNVVLVCEDTLEPPNRPAQPQSALQITTCAAACGSGGCARGVSNEHCVSDCANGYWQQPLQPGSESFRCQPHAECLEGQIKVADGTATTDTGCNRMDTTKASVGFAIFALVVVIIVMSPFLWSRLPCQRFREHRTAADNTKWLVVAIFLWEIVDWFLDVSFIASVFHVYETTAWVALLVLVVSMTVQVVVFAVWVRPALQDGWGGGSPLVQFAFAVFAGMGLSTAVMLTSNYMDLPAFHVRYRDGYNADAFDRLLKLYGLCTLFESIPQMIVKAIVINEGEVIPVMAGVSLVVGVVNVLLVIWRAYIARMDRDQSHAADGAASAAEGDAAVKGGGIGAGAGGDADSEGSSVAGVPDMAAAELDCHGHSDVESGLSPGPGGARADAESVATVVTAAAERGGAV